MNVMLSTHEKAFRIDLKHFKRAPNMKSTKLPAYMFFFL